MEIKLTIPALVILAVMVLALTYMGMKSKPILVNDYSGAIVNPVIQEKEYKTLKKGMGQSYGH
jgi:hypothetical protein